MKERKYKEEYKLVTKLDAKGRPKQIPVYMGDYHAYADGVNRAKLAHAGLPHLAAFVIAYGAYMALGSPSSYCIYVLPFACCAILPLLYAVLGTVNMLRFTGKMTRVQKETGIARLMRSLIGCGAFTALAAFGDAVFMLRNGFAGEALAALLLLYASVSAFMGFNRVRRIHNAMTIIPGKAALEAKAAQMKAGEQA